MELQRAIKRMYHLEKEQKALEDWFLESKGPNKPVYGQTWFKLERAIDDVICDLVEEHSELEKKIAVAIDGIEIDHEVPSLKKNYQKDG